MKKIKWSFISKMKKITSFCIILSILFLFCSCTQRTRDAVSVTEKSRYVYLIAGFDEATENTDVLFTLSYDFDDNSVYVAQIPRDTYFGFGKAQNKINQVYAVRRLAGDDKNAALSNLSYMVSEAFGTEFDGYLGISIETFKKLVDLLDGIDIDVPEDMKITSADGSYEIFLKKGTNHITGIEAESFIRYRKGYVTGDLGRIDAQKLFLNALFKKASEGISLSTLIGIFSALKDDIITNIKISEAVSLFGEITKSKEEKTTYFVTMPGEAIQNKNGLSFYVLNRKNSAEVAKKYMNTNKEFDLKRIFFNSGDIGFMNIYEDENSNYSEYSNKNINEISIK